MATTSNLLFSKTQRYTSIFIRYFLFYDYKLHHRFKFKEKVRVYGAINMPLARLLDHESPDSDVVTCLKICLSTLSSFASPSQGPGKVMSKPLDILIALDWV